MSGSGSHYWQQKFIGLNIFHGIMGLNYIMKGRILKLAFQSLPPADIMATVKVVHDKADTKPSKAANKESHPKFGPHSSTKVADFDFPKGTRMSSLQAQSGRCSFG